jgi:hypothetical protein
MKTFHIVLVLVFFTIFRAAAQVTVQVTTDQDEFLPSESIPLAVKITNRSGQQLHLGDNAGWLTFSVESVDGFIVNKNAEVPVQGEFDLESSQLAIKRVDIAPYFSMNRPGRYKVTAMLHIKSWSQTIGSLPKVFDIVTGAKIWSQDFGVPAAGGAPEMRRFTLEEANYLREQLRLYVQLSDSSESRVFKVQALGPMVSFGAPDEQVDRTSQLHVLWQTGGQSFSYCLISPDGMILKRDTYDNFNGRPKLKITDDGDVLVVGGTRRIPASEIPDVIPPVEVPAASTAPAAPAK